MIHTHFIAHLFLVYMFIYRCECYDYLFDIAVQMKLHGLDPTAEPKN